MSQSFSRRDALKEIAIVVGAAGAASTRTRGTCRCDAASESDRSHRRRLATTRARRRSRRADFPTYAAGQMCSTGAQLPGNAGDPYRPGNICPGKAVNANGWCKVWVQKAQLGTFRRLTKPRGAPDPGAFSVESSRCIAACCSALIKDALPATAVLHVTCGLDRYRTITSDSLYREL